MQLRAYTRRGSTAPQLRARIVLACSEGLDNKSAARKVGVAAATAGRWRRRFVEDRLDGLLDEP
ncbi:helix-turn-helix domain-containing protein [Sorangium sp. So ce145]|uniref:helix-turn-helix domain-containing protein n=1 Tax=Sorangium sp. So ce145 TaxID=3133285 RepID=UPI003F61D5B8